MNGFAALDIPPCRRYVVVKATAGFAVCRLILKLLLFYSCLDFTQNLGKTQTLVAPFALALSLLVALLVFLFDICAVLLTIASMILTVLGVALFFTPTPIGGIVFLFLVFLLSP